MKFSWRKQQKIDILYRGSVKFAELLPVKINNTTKYYWIVFINNQIIFNNKTKPVFGKNKAKQQCLNMVKEDLEYS